jgi:phosphoglycerate dehydrogenase-like enzyme
MRNAAGAIVSTDPFDDTVFQACRTLRVIARVGVGYDSIDVVAATAAGVVITTTPGANEETAADHALALMLAVLRGVVEHDASVRRGEWDRAGDRTPACLNSKTVGLVGFGAIGRAVAKRLTGFGVEVLVTDPAVNHVNGGRLVSLDELLRHADVVSLHVPFTKTTTGMIGAPQLETMRANSVLINTARGGLVDEAALVKALRSGHLRGAGLDVFVDEPPRMNELLSLPNVVLSPHIAGLSRESIAEMTARATMSTLAVLKGESTTDAINPEAAYVRRAARSESL